MGHADPSAVMRPRGTHPAERRHTGLGPQARGWFATRAQARLLDVLGWQVAPSPRREVERHAPLQCCFVLRDGRREEAAFGYTGLTAPGDTACAALAAAQRRVEEMLDRLGEASGLLLQNDPVVAFGPGGTKRMAVFGGWRVSRGRWAPFLLGPGGLGAVAAQETLFAAGTAPHHLAEVCGHPADRVLGRLAGLARALAAPGGAPDRGPDQPTRLAFVPLGSGWSTARVTAAAPPAGPLRLDPARPLKSAWEAEADEFRFHRFGADRG